MQHQKTDPQSNPFIKYIVSFEMKKREQGMNLVGVLKWMMEDEQIRNELLTYFGVDLSLLQEELAKREQDSKMCPGTISIAAQRVWESAVRSKVDGVTEHNATLVARDWVIGLLTEPIPNPAADILVRARIHPKYVVHPRQGIPAIPATSQDKVPYLDHFMDSIQGVSANASKEHRAELASCISEFLMAPNDPQAGYAMQNSFKQCLVQN